MHDLYITFMEQAGFMVGTIYNYRWLVSLVLLGSVVLVMVMHNNKKLKK